MVEQAHQRPAHQLLGFGQVVLDSLGPDIVYIGGTDAGRSIPSLLNETSDGAGTFCSCKMLLPTYLNYVRFRYNDRLKTFNGEDSQQAFPEYPTDAQRRLQRDQQSPDEDRQICDAVKTTV